MIACWVVADNAAAAVADNGAAAAGVADKGTAADGVADNGAAADGVADNGAAADAADGDDDNDDDKVDKAEEEEEEDKVDKQEEGQKERLAAGMVTRAAADDSGRAEEVKAGGLMASGDKGNTWHERRLILMVLMIGRRDRWWRIVLVIDRRWMQFSMPVLILRVMDGLLLHHVPRGSSLYKSTILPSNG